MHDEQLHPMTDASHNVQLTEAEKERGRAALRISISSYPGSASKRELFMVDLMANRPVREGGSKLVERV